MDRQTENGPQNGPVSGAIEHLQRNTSPDQKAAIIAVTVQMDLSSVLSRVHDVLDPELVKTLVQALAGVEKIADYLTSDN